MFHDPPLKRPVGRPRLGLDPRQVQSLRACGLSYRQIAQKLGCGYGTVRRASHQEAAVERLSEPNSIPVRQEETFT